METVLIADGLIAQILLIVGTSVFGLFGAIHLMYTFFSNKFEAFDSDVTEAMNTSSLIMTKETTIWKAWLGI